MNKNLYIILATIIFNNGLFGAANPLDVLKPDPKAIQAPLTDAELEQRAADAAKMRQWRRDGQKRRRQIHLIAAVVPALENKRQKIRS